MRRMEQEKGQTTGLQLQIHLSDCNFFFVSLFEYIINCKMLMKRLYIDMDGVLVDFQSGIDRTDTATLENYDGHYDDIPGIFARMDPMTIGKKTFSFPP